MPYGTFIANLEVEGTDRASHGVFDTEFNYMVVESDPHCDGHGRTGTDENLCRGVLGARFIGQESKRRSAELSPSLV